jgi:hypothetical protein
MSSKKTKEVNDEELEILEDEVIQKPKRTPRQKVKPEPEYEPEYEPEPEKPLFKPRKEHKKVEWVMTPARAEALKKAQARLKERNDAIREAKEAKAEEERKIIEEKVIKKAIALKKRQLKKEAVIDDIPVDVPLRPKPKPIVVEPKYEPKYKFY